MNIADYAIKSTIKTYFYYTRSIDLAT